MRPHKPDYLFLSSIGVLLVFGLLTLFSASSAEGYVKFQDIYFFVKRQILLGILPGLVLFWLASRLDYHFWQKAARPLFYFSLLLLGLVLIPGLSGEIKTAHSWFTIGGFSFQPSELAKLALVLHLAAWLARWEEVPPGWTRRLLPLIVILILLSVLLLKQPDFGTLMILIIIALGLYFVGGGRWLYLGGLGGAGLLGLTMLLFFGTHRHVLKRFLVFLNPGLEPQGLGYQINQALLAIGSGGFWGLGWGHSRQKFQYLPEARADSIFAIIGEELGFLVSSLFILFLGFVFWRGMKIAEQAPDKFGKLIVSGVMIWLIGQSFVNISSMLGLLPLTGLPLPLVSHGGSALVLMLAALGIVVNVSRQTRES